jgi:hypothetical protein
MRRLAPPGGGLRQAALLLAALALCPLAALLIGDDPAAPVARARALIDVERALGLHVEPAAVAWARGHGTLLDLAAAFYLAAHVGVAGWALVWTWFLRRDRFAVLRDTFLWLQGLLVLGYVLVPTAPPWLVPETGIENAVGGLGGGVLESGHVLQSPYAALPSGHVAFALVAGAAFARWGDQAWLRAFGWGYPPLVVAVTVVTGNHLLLDAAAAAGVTALACGLAAGRPQRWVAGCARLAARAVPRAAPRVR